MKLMKEIKSNIIIKNENGDDDVDTEGRTTDGKLVFTKTTEFTARLQARLNEDARVRAETAIQKAIASSSSSRKHMNDDDMDIEGAAIVEEDSWEGMDTVNDNNDNVDDEDDEDNDDQLGFIHDQPLVARGMAATLNLLKGTGELKRQQQMVGRANDEREGLGSLYDNGIQLDYRDDQGRVLTKKEAFRQVCYDFHGYGAGKNKRDKRIKAAVLEEKNSSSRSGPAGTMLALNQVQKATGKAFLKLN
jgi:U4/U6.U5 tri-snRNP-associated protein 1